MLKNAITARDVLIYADDGTSRWCVEQTARALRDTLGPHTPVRLIDATFLRETAWEIQTKLLVMPGGRDLPYLAKLRAPCLQRIRAWVEGGGSYLGLCAGGYFGASNVIFTLPRDGTQIAGPRPLAFYPDTCAGPVWPDFADNSEAGAHATDLNLCTDVAPKDFPARWRAYQNGGGAFVRADLHANVTVVAMYAHLSTDNAAIVSVAVGLGTAVLTGVHPEFAAASLGAGGTQREVFEALTPEEPTRRAVWAVLLRRLGCM